MLQAMNNLPIPKYHLVGHRGTAGLRPENTYCSFSYAAELGLDWIEFDVQLSKDDRWIVMHDDDLDRTTTGRGLVREWTSDDLVNLDAGLWFKPPYPGEKIPTLLGTLQLAQKLNLFCDVEIKASELDPYKHASLFAAFISAHAAFANNILVTSFDLNCLIEIRALLPDLTIGINIENFTPDTINITQEHNFANINCNVKKITKDDLKAAQAANIPVFLYTVNDQSTAKLWIENGATAVFTDRPDLLLPI